MRSAAESRFAAVDGTLAINAGELAADLRC
jgi:hypothetical protein